jgi:hypothetical protein
VGVLPYRYRELPVCGAINNVTLFKLNSELKILTKR